MIFIQFNWDALKLVLYYLENILVPFIINWEGNKLLASSRLYGAVSISRKSQSYISQVFECSMGEFLSSNTITLLLFSQRLDVPFIAGQKIANLKPIILWSFISFVLNLTASPISLTRLLVSCLCCHILFQQKVFCYLENRFKILSLLYKQN